MLKIITLIALVASLGAAEAYRGANAMKERELKKFQEEQYRKAEYEKKYGKKTETKVPATTEKVKCLK